ncbi:UDP-glucuronate:xylan alpha-glucuronosyltransferase 2 isoform X2 [Andrographis paniculata]|uniref:UDP-glucuronate:xylan alpha-glucuronosyltransferase 2 isoform X2 n=1 Tax=Andrographis paniculata TaxID=175694 RepID=UPI0021E958C6|nr:UDP-glucuronate:xylan alpha-glucuronosyltransferase 2 isoform X2 [Andrographis paniculata]
MVLLLRKMFKSTSAKALIIRINLVFLAFFLILYVILLLCPAAADYHQHAATLVRCSFRDCHHKMEAVLEMSENGVQSKPRRELIKRENPSFLSSIGTGMRIAMVNMEDEDVSEWNELGQIFHVQFDRVSELLKWKDIFPEWIDEEEEYSGSYCPEVPMPNWDMFKKNIDVIVAKLPCRAPEEGWNRDLFRLQVHLVAANMAVRKGRRDSRGTIKLVFVSKCTPMVEIFRCDDVVKKEGEWWYFQPEMARLEQKVLLPVGSCNLALPLWDKGIDRVYDVSKLKAKAEAEVPRRREAYVTVLHSSESYVCGAITLARSLIGTGTRRELILLLDTSISVEKRAALATAGWSLRFIERIRNPRAEKDSYNEYNYSKFRLWQLTDYEKVIFIDSDVVVLRNMDLLFEFPQMSATGNDGWIFNSGVMVIEPSNCTFRMLMQRRHEIVSYNGGDQGFLNEVFVWWHRLPRRVNFLKNFWSNSSIEESVKNQLLGAEPAKVYSVHYLGLKPWMCYRDYDCNWNVADQRVYASDEAHRRWWKLHDGMEEELQKVCRLSKRRKIELAWDRKVASKMGFQDGHWRINVTDQDG